MVGERILIVEDEGIVARDIQNILEGLGYVVCSTASSGEEAVEKAKELNPGLVLMDIVLKGGINGIAAAEQIRNLDIPVIYLTAYTDDLTLKRAKETKPFGYINKPFNERELYVNIELALHNHKIEQELNRYRQHLEELVEERTNELFQEKELLAVTLHSIGDAVIATDIEGRVGLMNKEAEKLCGLSFQEAKNRPLTKVFCIVNEQTRKPCSNPVEMVCQSGQITGLANNTLLLSKDGREYVIEDSAAPIKDRNGKLIGIILVFRDATEKVMVQKELQKMERLEALGLLAGGIAHDFNNILTIMLINLYTAKTEKKNKDIIAALERIEKAIQRAIGLTQQLLAFSKGGIPIKGMASIGEILKETTEFVLHGSKSMAEISIPDDLPQLEIDPTQIAQVINNIIINADQSMPEGGVIRIRVEEMSVKKSYNLPIEDGGYVRIAISDSGVGIPKEHLYHIFEPYFTTKQKGSGLGLSIAFSIVKHHNGWLTVESDLGKGTCFYIYLPVKVEMMEIKRDKEFAHLLELRVGRILFMDAEEDIRTSAQYSIESLGYQVETAKDGAEAIELYQKAIEMKRPFDLVILDITVPAGIGGKETIKRLKGIDPGVKAIISSGYSTDALMVEPERYGFCGMIRKPYTIESLAQTIQRVLKAV